MASETTQAAILILRAKAIEIYGILKDMYAKQAELGDSEKIASHALQLAQYEGAMITLQQYFNNAEQPPPDEIDLGLPEQEEEPRIVGPEDSESMRRTMEAHAATREEQEKNES